MKYKFEKIDEEGNVVTTFITSNPNEFRLMVNRLLPEIAKVGWISTTTIERLNKAYESVKEAGLKLIEEVKKFGNVEDVGRKYHVALFKKKSGGKRKRFAVLEVRKSKIRIFDGKWSDEGISATIQSTADVSRELIEKLRILYEKA